MSSTGQDLCFELLGSTYVNDLVEFDGQLWVGTQEGLVAYDPMGNITAQYDTDNSLCPGDNVHAVQNYNGDLIMSIDSALYWLDQGQFSPFADAVWGEMAVKSGRLCVANGTTYYEFENDQLVYQKDLLEEVVFTCDFCDKTTDLVVDESNTVWISHYGFYEYDIVSYDAEGWSLYDHATVSPDVFPVESWNDYNRLAAVENQILASSWAGLKMYDNGSWTLNHSWLNPVIISASDTLYSVAGACADPLMGYWVGEFHHWQDLAPGRMAYWNGLEWQIFSAELPLTTDLHRLLPSNDGNYIYAASNNGVLRVDRNCLGVETSIGPTLEQQLVVYPNPSAGFVNFSKPVTGQVQILDAHGTMVFEKQIVGTSYIEISNLASGAYILRLHSDHQIYVHRLLVN